MTSDRAVSGDLQSRETYHQTTSPLLFEHFLVIGPSTSTAYEKAKEIQRESSVSRRISRRITGLLKRSFSSPNTSGIAQLIHEHSSKSILDSDVINVEPSILYRYPEDADPPPPEVTDFCLPQGGKLQYIDSQEEETIAEEIFYGLGGSNDHLSRCFIFLLEDKTIESSAADEIGIDANRLYGICIIHPRVLRVHVENEQNELTSYVFESKVCYAFITRFPMFEFFFSAMSSMITAEKLERMEIKNVLNDSVLEYCKYVPAHIIEAVLHQIKNIKPPKYNSEQKIEFIRGVAPITFSRKRPTLDFPEYMQHAISWALPMLLSWLPVDRLIWLLSLLMCEVKIIVIGCEPGMVSCVVLSLLALLRPLSWVAPLIPVLPLKYVEFIESPVPILAGMIIDDEDDEWSPGSLLQRCE